ncbi:MAG: fibronectin type III domain-containing protein, partial [Actinomycetota bacterium]
TTATTTTTTIAVTTTVPTTTTSTSSTTTTTVASRVSGSFAGYLGGNCPDGSGLPWYWGSDGRARAGGCSAAASIAPISTGGSGSSDSAATTTTTVAPVVVPGTPATPTGVAGNTQVTVSVTAGTGGTPTSYTITKSTTSGGTYSTGCTVTGASGSCVVTGLTNGTAYFFKTTATNSAGTSSLSTASSAVTPATVPDAPTIGTATVASATSVTVACTAPGSNGGAAIDSYTFTSSPAGGTVTINSLTCTTTTITGLTTGTAYTFTVTATNSRGTSVASAVSNSVTPATVYTVGSTGPGGGLVFYVASGTFTSTGSDCNTACKYFEVAPSDQGINIPVATTAAFCYAAGSNSGVSDCQRNSIYSNTDGQAASRNASTAIGMGMANTNALYARMTTAGGAAVSTYNAGIAWAYSNNGKTDWHLPSKDELNQLCKWNGGLAYVSDATVCTGGTLNSATNGANGSAFTTNAYWSSSEYSIDATQSQNFPTGNVNLGFFRGDADKRFRAVRAFG